MPAHVAPANAQKSKMRSRIENIFAHHKDADGAVRESHRHCARHRAHHLNQYGLQHAGMVLAECAASGRMTP